MTAEPEPIDWGDVPYDVPTDVEPEPQPTPARTPLEFPTTTPTGNPAAMAERARVLRHPDIAKRLCDPPLRYSRPEVWNGYLPPETWREQVNDSPQRAALVDIIAAAVAADQQQETT